VRVSDEAAKWDLYLDAVIECEADGRNCRLRGPAAEPLPADEPIFVLTAYNPGGEDRADALNEAAEQALERELVSAGATFWPAIGRSRDGSWAEPGVALARFDRSKACAYGTRYGQLAVYELTAEQVYVVRCNDAVVVRSAARRK
jgi:hypothetical protein